MAHDSARASLELLYHVSRELAGALELRAVLQRVLFLSLKNVGGERGSVVVLDDQGNAVDSAIVYGVQVHNDTTQQLRETVDRGLAGWVVRNRKAVVLPDTSRDERWLRRPDDASDRTGAKSALCVPLLARERFVGVLTIVHPDPGFFTEEHLALMQAIADQAGITVLNARLYDESQRQARVMTALAESAVSMTASLQLDQVLQRILDETAHAMGVETVLLGLIDETTQEVEFRAGSGQGKPAIGRRLPLGTWVAGKVAQTGKGQIITNAADLEAMRLPGLDIREMVCVPVHVQGKIIGILEAINPLSGHLEPEALPVMNGIGSLAGIAIQNAQFYGQVQSAHQRYHELFEDSIDLILITDRKGHIQEANRQAATTSGFDQATLQLLSIGEVHQLQPEKTGVDFSQVSPGKTISYESTLLAASGAKIPIQVHVRQVTIDGCDCFQWIMRDISEHKALDGLREDLFAMVYHDLRSPLANVVSSLEVMGTLLPKENSSSLQMVLKIATRATDRIQRLVNSLLDIHRLEAGQLVANRTEVDPSTLLIDALDAVKPLYENKQQEMSVAIPENLPALSVDEDMIRRVLINLLENSIKFTPAGGKLGLGVRKEDTQVQVWVQDTGPGIPPEQQEAVFEKFTRLRTEFAPKGLGLGLAFCRLAVEAHGGKIWVESQPGAGSRFIFNLPVEAPAAEKKAA